MDRIMACWDHSRRSELATMLQQHVQNVLQLGKHMHETVLAVVKKEEYLVLAESNQKRTVFNSHVHKAIKALLLSFY